MVSRRHVNRQVALTWGGSRSQPCRSRATEGLQHPYLPRCSTYPQVRTYNSDFDAALAAALLAAFASLGIAELGKSSAHIVTVVVSALTVAVCLGLAKALNAVWLREWGLGFSIIVGLVVAYFVHTAGLGPAPV